MSGADQATPGQANATRRIIGKSPDPQVESLRQRLAEMDEEIADRYWSRHNVEDLLRERTRFFDDLIREIWATRIPERAHADLCLIAVGGYGRGELFPHSDIDLLILTRRPRYWAEEIRGFLHTLYDLNLDVGHSVRQLSECKTQARDDITVATAMFERRLLTGAEKLYLKLDKILDSPRLWPPDKFFRAKLAEQQRRHSQFDNIEYGLEPNIKSSPGGLRDLQTAMWVFQRQFGTTNLHDLETLGALSTQERVWFTDGRRFLWWVRFGLHLVAQRKEDRLQFEYQRALAQRLGFADTDAKLGVERFMNHYYRHVLELREVNDIVLQYFDESILRSREKPVVEAINERFRTRNHYLEVASPDVFRESPSALLELFVIMANRRDIAGVRADTIRSIRENLDVIDDGFRNDPANTRLFVDLLKAPYTLVSQLTRMRRYGVLSRYLPEFGDVVGQMQHDLFHIYTVDAHTMMVIRNMRRFHYRSSEEHYPVACYCVRNIPKIELLYVAGLYHDIGKGRGGDHSQLGAGDAAAFCRRHNIVGDDAELVSWLVAQHLLMSSIAQRRDIYDPEVIMEFAKEVKSERRLHYLYALTVADINATNPTLWNNWRATLLRTLYSETRKALRRGLESPIDREASIQACKEAALDKLSASGMSRTDVENSWRAPSSEFFLRHTPRQVAAVTQRMHEHDPHSQPLVILLQRRGQVAEEGTTEICVYAADRPLLFAATVSALTQMHLSVVDADIHTSEEGICLNSFMVLDEQGRKPAAGSQPLDAELTERLATNAAPPEPTRRRLPRPLKQLPTDTEVRINTTPGDDHSTLTVIASDRPGLLAGLGTIFAELGIAVRSARIATLGERVEDVFAIVNPQGSAYTDDEEIYVLENTVRQRLDQQIANEL